MSQSQPVISPGLADIPVAESAISFIDGKRARLEYRGIAVETLARHGKDAGKLDTIYVLVTDGTDERVLQESRAILHVFRQLGGGWKAFAAIVGVLPTVVLNVGYRIVARTRYWVFGKYEACQLPSPEERSRFVAQSLPE